MLVGGYTNVAPEAETTVRGSAPTSGWVRSVYVEFEGRSPPRWLLRVLRLTLDGREVLRRGPADSLGLSMFEGRGFEVQNLHLAAGAPIELVVQNPSTIPMALRVSARTQERHARLEPWRA